MLETIKRITPLNFALMSHPMNWLVITLMVLSAGLMLQTLVQSATILQQETR